MIPSAITVTNKPQEWQVVNQHASKTGSGNCTSKDQSHSSCGDNLSSANIIPARFRCLRASIGPFGLIKIRPCLRFVPIFSPSHICSQSEATCCIAHLTETISQNVHFAHRPKVSKPKSQDERYSWESGRYQGKYWHNSCTHNWSLSRYLSSAG